VGTLEDAAEALVVKLKGLDSEVDESEHKLEALRGRIEGTSDDVEQEWSALTEAVSSFLGTMRNEQERLHQETEETLQAAGESRQVIHENGAQARSEIAEGRSLLDALAQHAAGLEPGVESLVVEAGEAPARSLAERAGEVEQELTRVLEEARDFLRDEVVTGLEEVAEDIRDRCQDLRRTLAEEGPAALQAAFDDWESKVDELEAYVSTQAFVASHEHAHAVVDYALGHGQAVCEQELERLRPLLEVLGGQLQELAAEVERSGEAVAEQSGTELVRELDDTRQGIATALSALGSVRDRLATYTFVQI